MLDRDNAKNTYPILVTRDEDTFNNSQAQASEMPFASTFAPANPNTHQHTHQPYSPSVLWAGGDNLLTVATAFFTGRKRAIEDNDQDNDMEAQVQAQGCDFVTTNLSAYLDGELDSAQTRLVGSHLGKCPRCSEILESLSDVDETIQREWRDSAPLPSSFHFEQAIDDIMAALPSVPVEAVAFAAHRVHARARWMRFATGIAGLVAILTSLWSSYWLGYTNGRRSLSTPGSVFINPFRVNPSQPLSPAPARTVSLSQPVLRLTPALFLLPSHPIARLHSTRLSLHAPPSPFSRSVLLTRAAICP